MTCTCYDQKCSCEQCLEKNYKKTLRNRKKLEHWKTRNGSGAINAILAPDINSNMESSSSDDDNICDYTDILPDKVTKTTSKIKFGNRRYTSSRYHSKCFGNKTKPRRAKHNFKRNVQTDACRDCPCISKDFEKEKFKNQCYCSCPRNKPTLPGKPDFILPVKKAVRPIKMNLAAPHKELKSTRSLETLQMAKDLDYIPQSEFLYRMHRDIQNLGSCACSLCKLKTESLQYTDHRRKLEAAYKNYEDNKPSFVCDTFSCCHVKSSENNSDNISLKCNPPNSVYSDMNMDARIHAVKHIRKDNYFETHANENVTAPCGNESHKCIFKYTTDERALLKSLNPDAYGTNRCSICNKVQINNTVNTENYSVNATNGSSLNSPRYAPESSQQHIQTEYKNFSIPSNEYENLEKQKKNTVKNVRKTQENLNLRNNENINIEQKTQRNNQETVIKNGPQQKTSNEYFSQNYVKVPTQSFQQKNQVNKTNIQQNKINNENSVRKKANSAGNIPQNNKRIIDTFTPRQISLPNANEIVELNLPPAFISTQKQIKLNIKIAPTNTWALRFQKGVV